MKKYILALDQGTTSSRAILFNQAGEIAGMSQTEFPQIYPQPGWVEHDPLEIWGSQSGAMSTALGRSGISPNEISAIGITNQRETTILWDRKTGKSVFNAIVWQDRRTASIVDEFKKDRDLAEYIQANTGLVLDAYFSGTKIKWILDNVPGVRDRAMRGEIAFGTTDSWILWHLTKGKVHATDYTNASRTLLYNIKTQKWDDRILKAMGIPASILPQVHPSSYVYGTTTMLGDVEIPIAGIAGDQQASLFGQASSKMGQVKNTYGTGCFMLMHTGSEFVATKSGLLTTMACSIDTKPQYALEGSVFVTGAAVQWLRDEMRFITSSEESEYHAGRVKDTGGVYFVPAFVGLGAPYWDMYARGMIIGLTRGTSRRHIIRATLESIAYQTKDVLLLMQHELGKELKEMRVDGGGSQNNLLMQFQSDILGVPIKRAKVIETTALGAAYLAGIAVGFWKSVDEIEAQWGYDGFFEPKMEKEASNKLYRGWVKAVKHAQGWLKDE